MKYKLLENKISELIKLITITFVTINFLILPSLKPNEKIDKKSEKKNLLDFKKNSQYLKTHSISWEEVDSKFKKEKTIKWEQISEEDFSNTIELQNNLKSSNSKHTRINIINRSLVFNNERIGPDISWVIPPGLKWNNNYKFDLTTRGHNSAMNWEEGRELGVYGKRKIFGWNKGDAVALISYQFLHLDKSSFGVNFGVRSLDQSNGGTKIGEGLSGGFRFDYELSETSGIAFGAEQFLHFDRTTDTGRNMYITASKGWWSKEFNGIGIFPLYIATGGFGTGRLAVGNVKGLCSDAFGGDGVHNKKFGRLCWAPIFSLAAVWDEQVSTFFEYNSRLFILGSSYAPFQDFPLRATLGFILSDYDDDYKLHDFSEVNWIFNLSLGF